MRRLIDAIRSRLREWLGIVYLDKHLSGQIRDLETWRSSCIKVMATDHHDVSRDIIILAGRFGAQDKVHILSVEFRSVGDLARLAKALQADFAPKPRYYWDGGPDFGQMMRGVEDKEL